MLSHTTTRLGRLFDGNDYYYYYTPILDIGKLQPTREENTKSDINQIYETGMAWHLAVSQTDRHRFTINYSGEFPLRPKHDSVDCFALTAVADGSRWD